MVMCESNVKQSELIKGYLGRFSGLDKNDNCYAEKNNFGDVAFRCLYKDGKIGNISFIIVKNRPRTEQNEDAKIKVSYEKKLSLLREMAKVDVRTVNPDDLVDIADVHINKELPVKERLADYISQIRNPYCYKSHGVVVKISFAGTRKLEECIGACVAMES